MSAPPLTRPAPTGWESVHFVDTGPDAGELAAARIQVATIKGDAIKGKPELMNAIAVALQFPDYFGGNWDALGECLRDLGAWLQAPGYVLLVERAESLWKRDPELAGMLVRTWMEASEVWAERGVSFHLVFVR